MVRRYVWSVMLAAFTSGCSLWAPSDADLGGGVRQDGGGGAGAGGTGGGGTGGAPSVTLCSGIAPDPFDQANLPAQWNASEAGSASVVPSSDGVRIELGIADGQAYVASTSFAMRDCAIVLHVKEFPSSDAQSYVFFNVQDSNGTIPQLYAQEGQGYAQRADGVNVEFGHGAQTWWRLREEQGMLYFDVSDSGLAWSTLTSEVTPIEATVSAAFGAGSTGQPSFDPGAALFADFNLPPGG